MKRRSIILTAALALLVFLAIPMGMKGQSTKTEGFESATTSTTYNSTVTVNANQSDCGIGWSIYYGTVSTNGALVGSKSAQMRWYKSASSNYPYLKSTTAIDNLTNVAFKAKVGNTAVKMDVSYSTDGNSWTALATAVTFSNTNATDFSYSIPSGGKYIKIGVSSSSTASMGSYYALLIDNVVFTYSSNVNTYTVTYHANVTGVSDIEVEYNEGDDVTIAANTFTNPGYAFTEWNTEADGTGDSYSPGDIIQDIDEDIDLYAQWEVSTSTTGMIRFGSSTGHVKINAASVTGDDDINNEWTITTVGTTSFTQSSTYSQVGSGSSPATSITFTTTLPEEVEVTSMEVKFGGFSGTAGTITMKVGSQTIGTGSLNATNDVVVNSSSTATGDVLTVTVTSISKGVKCYYISYTYEEATPDPAVTTTTTITVPSDFNSDIHNGTSAGTLTATVAAGGTAISGATVTWESSNTSVATIDANGAVTLVAVGSTTITASYAGVEDQYRPSSDTYELTVIDSYAPGTQNNPYTVAQARAAIDANTGITGVYATGIVSAIPTAWSTQYNNITFNFVDNTGDTEFLQAYRCVSSSTADASQVQVGDIVVVYGNLKKYSSTYEFDAACQLVSLTHPAVAVEAPTFSPAAGTYTSAQTVTLNCETSGASIYYTTDGTEPDNNSTQYTTALTISTTTTIKAVAYDGTNYSNVTTATYHFCSADDPYTVTEALAFNEYPANGIYVTGIVSTAPTQAPTNNGELTYYISVDGQASNQLEVFKGKGLNQAAFTAQGDIQVGDIVTVYGNVVIYGTTNPIKEFAQGNYLVSFERPAQQYTLTVTPSANVEIYTFVGDDPTQEGQAGAFTTQVYNGTTVGISVSAEEGYILSLIVDGTDVTSQLDETGWYEFTMPAHNVTVTATASIAPVVTTNTYTLATSIESGKQYIIVGWADSKAYAMGYQKSNNRHAVEISVNGNTATATIADTQTNAYEFTITSLGQGFYSIEDATGSTGGYLYAAGSNANHLKTESTLSDNSRWEITVDSETGLASVSATNSNNRHIMRFNNGDKLFACYASASQHDVYLYVKDEPRTYPKPIAGWSNAEPGVSNFYLIASPIGDVAPTAVTIEGDATATMVSDSYDLYYFDHNRDLEWVNYKDANGNPGAFNLLESGKGYLYANLNDVTLVFTGTGRTSGTETIELAYVNEGDGYTIDLPGWNLLGNPFADNAYLVSDNSYRSFYTMGVNGNYLSVTGDVINAMEGIFVKANGTGESVTFTTTQLGRKSSTLALNLSNGRNLIDRAIVRFDGGDQLPKLQFRQGSTKVYIPVEGQDYAVVSSEEMGTMPVSFKAEENGSYNLSLNSENVSFAYLHLIDNLTGADVDLLQTPSYSFEAKTTDYSQRFKLVFATGDNSNEDNFAFFSNGSFVINNEGTAMLQVIDVTGRIVKSESINGCANVNVNAAPGVYMLRLVNGDNVKVQKVVVK